MVHLYQVLDWEVFFYHTYVFHILTSLFIYNFINTPKNVDQVLSSMDTLIVASYDYHARMFSNKANF